MTTHIVGGKRGKATTFDSRKRGTRLYQPFSGDEAGEFDDGPVTGWLVVVEGPGRGQAVRLGVGMNVIGASPESRVQLDFGDPGISRVNHFRIAYDVEGRSFHFLPGDGKNLVYAVSTGKGMFEATELLPHAELRTSKTVLRFVPLCGPEWSWSDTAADGASEL
jgi:hypothetical protein